MKNQPPFSEKLVVRVNELYHDSEASVFEELHPEIFKGEVDRWNHIADRYLVNARPVHGLDFGCGTGFVSCILAKKLKREDTLICTDLSSAVLDVCRKNLDSVMGVCACECIKSDGRAIPAAAASLDFITLNSVLHHLPDLPLFAQECRRALAAGGLLCIIHEPSGATALPLSGRLLRSVGTLFSNPSTLLFAMVEQCHWLEKLLRGVASRLSAHYRLRNAMLKEIANQLIAERLIDRVLSGSEIQRLVDIHAGQGFVLNDLVDRVFAGFTLLQSETWNYTGSWNRNIVGNAVDRYLSKKYPDRGRTLGLILQKKE
jgi:ubiquinone/menaquinone biosynthesis C-methylase UbiE